MKNEHRIEFICKTPRGKLNTITITVAANSQPEKLAALSKQIRALLELTLFGEPPLTIEHCRDYPVSAGVS